MAPGSLMTSIAGSPRQVARSNAVLAGILAGGVVLSLGLLFLQAPSGAVVVPMSLAIVLAVALVPRASMDRALAVGLVATMPLLPPVGLPNLPLGAALLGVAMVRLIAAREATPIVRPLVLISAVWLAMGLGALASHWPAASLWVRPVVILGFALVASVVGVLVGAQRERLDRWLDGFALALLAVSMTALIVFALQYVFGPRPVAEGVTGLLGYLRGERSAEFFARINNWLIFGDREILRAISPLVPSPNNLGGIIGLLAPLAAARWLTARETRWRRVSAAAVGLSVATLVLTYSRSTWLAALVASGLAIVLVAFLTRRRRLSWTTGAPLVPFVAVVGLGLGVGLAGLLSAGSAAATDRVTQVVDDPSVITRIVTGGQAAEAFQVEWLRGAGLGNWGAFIGDQSGTAYVHNVYLEYAIAVGVFGLAWTVLLVLLPFLAGGVSAVRARTDHDLVLGGALVAIGAFAAIQFMFDDNLLNPQYAWYLLWVVGAAASIALAARPTDTEGSQFAS
jgi:hypothetical protein